MKNLVIKKVLRICVAIYTISSAIYAQQPMITNPAFTEDCGGAEHVNQKLPLTKGEVLLDHVKNRPGKPGEYNVMTEFKRSARPNAILKEKHERQRSCCVLMINLFKLDTAPLSYPAEICSITAGAQVKLHLSLK